MDVEGISKWASDCPAMWCEMVYGRPGKCLDCKPTVLPRWGLRHRLFATGGQARNGRLTNNARSLFRRMVAYSRVKGDAIWSRRAKSLSDGNAWLDGNMLGKVLRDRLIRAVTRPPFATSSAEKVALSGLLGRARI
jgi:hypothetical protein